jgi:hypothetical protein
MRIRNHSTTAAVVENGQVPRLSTLPHAGFLPTYKSNKTGTSSSQLRVLLCLPFVYKKVRVSQKLHSLQTRYQDRSWNASVQYSRTPCNEIMCDFDDGFTFQPSPAPATSLDSGASMDQVFTGRVLQPVRYRSNACLNHVVYTCSSVHSFALRPAEHGVEQGECH